MYPWRISNQDFFLEETPSEKASLGLHKISLGIKSPSKADLSKCFSTPSCKKQLQKKQFKYIKNFFKRLFFWYALTKSKICERKRLVCLFLSITRYYNLNSLITLSPFNLFAYILTMKLLILNTKLNSYVLLISHVRAFNCARFTTVNTLFYLFHLAKDTT